MSLFFFFFLLPPESFCLGATLELRNNRTGKKYLYDKGPKLLPNNTQRTDYDSKLDTTTVMYPGAGNVYAMETIKRFQ